MDRVLIGRLTVRGALRVPEITAYFWVAKILTTALGESTSDYLVHRVNPYLAVSGLVAAAQGGDDCQCGIQAAAHIPGRQHVVDRTCVIGRSGDERESDTRVHGVVHSGGTVATPEQLNMDHVGTLGSQ